MCLTGKGITLVALVVTIIILLIIAGITINLTVGQSGILTRAQEAGKNYQEAAKKDEEDLEKFLGEVDNIIVGINDDKYTMIDGVPVPKGFKHTEGTKETGFVIQDNSGTETNGNEFVWVPCTENGEDGSIKYDRYAFLSTQPKDGIDVETNSIRIKQSLSALYYHIEAMKSMELNSIKKYGGFYIGRYEVGIVDYDTNVETINSNKLVNWTGYHNGKAVVQKGRQVWNYITIDKAKEIAEGMYTNNNIVESRLCSAYAWDTAIKFIETKNTEYATNSTQGNYKDTTFTYTDLNGDTQTKPDDSGVLVPTGQTTAVNNIYDIGGNVFEWTSEDCSSQEYPYTPRGGNFNNNASDYSAANRGRNNQTAAFDSIGFRTTLFLGL